MSLPGSIGNGAEAALGRSYGDRQILLQRRGAGTRVVLLIGGVHGDEIEGYLLAERFVRELDIGSLQLDPTISLYVIARLNPDGCAANRRTNERNVDLNRNLPTADWSAAFTNVRYYPGPGPGSELENVLLVRLLADLRPTRVLSLHSWENAMVNFNGPSEEMAIAMSSRNGLPPKGDIGYPTPGSLGTYAGWERLIPTITLEILRGQPPEETWRQHAEALKIGVEYLH
ncbi:MAG: DUF2817 domain-containing protein [Leptospirales bacterium]|nr:DUF2817 domain-containing protein [Leptospirales bacterium]